jgi:Universal stress protein family.
MTTLDIDLVLVPVDGSEASHEAVDYAIEIADEYDATVHALYVLDEEVVRALETGAVDEADVADDTASFTESVTERAEAAGVDHSNSIAYASRPK